MACEKMKKGFTLMELIVAIALLMMIFGFTAIVFRVSAESYRQAGAGTEIMVKLRAVTDQLNSDFKGLRKEAPLFIWFQLDPNDPNNRLDQIMFFATGDFQSTQTYFDLQNPPAEPYDIGEPIRGNAARIYYGQALSINPQNGNIMYPEELIDPNERILVRNQHILIADPCVVQWPDIANFNTFASPYDEVYSRNEIYEHDSMSLAHWLVRSKEDFEVVVGQCFGFPPIVNVYDANTYHNLLCEGVKSFAVQWAYKDVNDQLRWFPDDDPNGDGYFNDSHFQLIDSDLDGVGVYFNVPTLSAIGDWNDVGDFNVPAEYRGGCSLNKCPDALKFTFVICDSKGIETREDKFGNKIKGREFTHIVYLKD